MLRVAIQVTCMVLLASVFYDVLSCDRFHSTQTYRYIKQVGSSKFGKLFLKKFKKAKRKYLKSLVWPLCRTPTNHGERVDLVDTYVHLVDWPIILKSNAFSLMHQILIYLDKHISTLQHPTSRLFHNLLTVAKAGVAEVSQQIWMCAETAVEYMTNALLLH